MFEKIKEVAIPIGTVSPWPSNLAVCWLDTRNITYVAIIQLNNVHVGNWDNKIESEITWNTIKTSELTGNERTMDVTTVGLVHPNARNFPIVVIGSTKFINVYDIKKPNQKPLYTIGLINTLKHGTFEIGCDVGSYCRGVSCNDNTVLVGTHSGEIIVFMCNGDSSFSNKKNFKEHKHAITDISTCRYDEITVSADCQGELIVWHKTIKNPNSRILTKQNINVINVLRKQIIVGTLQGVVQYYSVASGDLMCEINAHSRPVSSVSVAPESAYVLTSSEDGTFVVSKLHTRKPHAYQVEYRFAECDPASTIVGAHFTNGRGSAIATTSYDSPFLSMYKIAKKQMSGAS